MDIKVYKTYEVPEELWQPIAEGFIESFERQTSAEDLKHSFCSRNINGYGYHAIAIADNGEVAGYNVFSPTFYKNGLKVVVSGSTYVRPKYRKDAFLFMKMVNALRTEVIKDGFLVEVGVPNHNSRKFATKVLGFKYVDDLDYYMLPLSLSKCLKKESLKFFDPIVKGCLLVHIWLQSVISFVLNNKEHHSKYELETDVASRKARFSEKYEHISKGEYDSYYSIVDEDGIRTAYIMDFRQGDCRTSKALNFTIRQIIRRENPDAILFVGFLRLCQLSLLKVPYRFIPKHLPFTYYVLNKEDKEQFSDMSNVRNWNFSLMNFDAR